MQELPPPSSDDAVVDVIGAGWSKLRLDAMWEVLPSLLSLWFWRCPTFYQLDAVRNFEARTKPQGSDSPRVSDATVIVSVDVEDQSFAA